MLLVLQSYLDGLALLVQVDIRDIASIECQVFLAHSVRIQCLIHAIRPILLHLLRHAARNPAGPTRCRRFDSRVVIKSTAIAS